FNTFYTVCYIFSLGILLPYVVLDGARTVTNALSPSVREKGPVCRMKCVFILDFVDVNLGFMGTSAKPLVLLNFGGRIVERSVPVTLMGSVTQSLVCARACPTAGATCAKTAANVDVMGNVTLSMATAPVRRAGGRPLAPKPVSATLPLPLVTKPQDAACVTKASGAKGAACDATAMCPLASSTQGPVSASMAGGVRPVIAAAFVISAMRTVTCKLAPVCATLVTKSHFAMSLVTVESMAVAVGWESMAVAVGEG
ncbi:hypothetical protein cypCar_00021225, partial [Cyprinus carpio]